MQAKIAVVTDICDTLLPRNHPELLLEVLEIEVSDFLDTFREANVRTRQDVRSTHILITTQHFSKLYIN